MATRGALSSLDAIGSGRAAGPGGTASAALLLEHYDDDFVGFGAPYTGGAAAAAAADPPCPDGYYDDFVASLRAHLAEARGAEGGALALGLAPGFLEAEGGWPSDDDSWGSDSDPGEDGGGDAPEDGGPRGAYDERNEYNGYGDDGAYDADSTYGADAYGVGDAEPWSGGAACPCSGGIAGAIVPVGAADAAGDAFAEFVMLDHGDDGDDGDDGAVSGGAPHPDALGGDTGRDEPPESDSDAERDEPSGSGAAWGGPARGAPCDGDDEPGGGSILAFVVARPRRA